VASLQAAVAVAACRLDAAGVETPRLDAELLLAHALGRDRTYLAAHGQDPLPPAARAAFEGLLARRLAREPLPYLLGRWEFYGMAFEVGPAVLIPRPETEVLVEAAAARLPPGARVLDLGTGSGCVAAALAKLLPGAEVLALEPSPEAAAVARRNAAALGLARRVRVLEAPFPEGAAGLASLDGVVSNPPYIPSKEVEELAPEVSVYEPRIALDGGPDGLGLLRQLAGAAGSLLRPGGLLAVEVALGQAERFARMLAEHTGWSPAETLSDMGGVPRVVLARWRV